jgi:transcriptional antiterminator
VLLCGHVDCGECKLRRVKTTAVDRIVAITAKVLAGNPIDPHGLAHQWGVSERTVRAYLKDVRQSIARNGLKR